MCIKGFVKITQVVLLNTTYFYKIYGGKIIGYGGLFSLWNIWQMRENKKRVTAPWARHSQLLDRPSHLVSQPASQARAPLGFNLTRGAVWPATMRGRERKVEVDQWGPLVGVSFVDGKRM